MDDFDSVGVYDETDELSYFDVDRVVQYVAQPIIEEYLSMLRELSLLMDEIINSMKSQMEQANMMGQMFDSISDMKTVKRVGTVQKVGKIGKFIV